MITPPTNPGPTPHPHCTVSTLVGAAFLMARASAIGVADATVDSDAMLPTSNAVTARVGARFVMWRPPLLGAASAARSELVIDAELHSLNVAVHVEAITGHERRGERRALQSQIVIL